MLKHVSNVIKSIAFLLILVVSLGCINQVLAPKAIPKNGYWPTTSTYNQFYDMEENSIDVLFMGSSVVVNAFSPQEIYNTYGIRSYNMASEQQSIFLTYFWLKEALRYQSPKVVVLDTRFLFEVHPESPINTTEGLTRKCLDSMRWSEVKREAVSTLCKIDESQSELSYYLQNIRFHTRWTEASEFDMIADEYTHSELKGYYPLAEYGPDSYEAYVPSGNTEVRVAVPDAMDICLRKIVELCEEEGIELVLTSLPGNFMNDAYNNRLNLYARTYGVDYYNFCEAGQYAALDAQLPRESALAHANAWGSIKLSRYMGDLLLNKYNVAPVVDDQYEVTREYYDHVMKNCELTHIEDINEYLEAINDPNYTVFIVGRDEIAAGMTDEIQERLFGLGLNTDLRGKIRWSYAAVISPENGVSETTDERDSVTLSGSIRDKNTIYSLSSAGYYAGSSSSIVIDGLENSLNGRGLNITVYDNSLMKVVDKVTFNTGASCQASR